jgi:hypothetical protein
MRTKLMPGDRVMFKAENSGRRLRGVVCDALMLKARGEELLVPVMRPRKGRSNVAAEHPDGQVRHLMMRWVPRSKLRKLPST